MGYATLDDYAATLTRARKVEVEWCVLNFKVNESKAATSKVECVTRAKVAKQEQADNFNGMVSVLLTQPKLSTVHSTKLSRA